MLISIKFEKHTNKKKTLAKESEILEKLNTKKIFGIPEFYDFKICSEFSYMAMQYLGPNLE